MTWRLIRCADSDPAWDRYLLFLLERVEELQLPYDFEMTFSFLGTPIALGDAFLVEDASSQETIAALGFVLGTGGQNYENRHVCQAEIMYIEPAYRGTRLFLRLVEYMVHVVDQGYPEVSLFQFWLPGGCIKRRALFEKLADRLKSGEKEYGPIDLYQVELPRLKELLSRFA